MQKRMRALMPDKSAELYNMSLVKLITMLLIVLCHSASIYMEGGWGPYPPARESVPLGLMASWLNTFHVHTFVAVSGYIFYYLRYETHRYDAAGHVIRNKAVRLLLPYACASILWVIPFDVAFWGFSPARLVREYLLCTNPCQLWFLPMLFFVFCAFTLLCTRIDCSAQGRKAVLRTLLALYVLSVLAGVLGGGDWTNVLQLRRAAQFLLYFYAGMQLRRIDLSRFCRFHYIAAAFAASVLLFAVGQFAHFAGGALSYIRVPLAPFASMAGVLFLILLCNRIARPAGTENGFFRLLRDASFPVYLFHQQFIYLVILLLNRASVAPYLLEEASFAVSLAASLLLTCALRRWRVTRTMFGIG